MTEIIKVENPESYQKAASWLENGGTIIYPTETLYGIGADASNEDSVRKVFNAKGRPHGKPIPILVKDKEMLAEVAQVTGQASKVIDNFLPGPLTLVLNEKKKLPALITAKTGKVAVRISSHQFIRKLFDSFSNPITSTSANISGSKNLFDISEISEAFGGKVDLIINSGRFHLSKGSTVVDLTVKPPLIVREGDISGKQLEEFF